MCQRVHINILLLLFQESILIFQALLYELLMRFVGAHQERVVSTLSLNVPSEVLSNYCLMWTLRPFVNEAFMKEALSWTRPFRH